MVTFTGCPNRTKRNTHLTEQTGKKQMSPESRRSDQYLMLALLSIMFVSSVALGQVLYGSIVGTVTDPNGAAVPGAAVELTNLATGAVSSTKTDDNGAYTINDLQVGTYKVTISGASFKKTIKEDVRIDANQTYRYDAQLEVGGVAETVVVTAGQEATLQTDRGDVNITKTDREINNLPLFGSVGRNY